MVTRFAGAARRGSEAWMGTELERLTSQLAQGGQQLFYLGIGAFEINVDR